MIDKLRRLKFQPSYFFNTQWRLKLPLAAIINDNCLRKIGRLPDLDNPKSYSDKIQWLKLFDQIIEQTICCDKLLARTFVAERVGKRYLLDLFHVSPRIDDKRFETIQRPFMLKANHDSGSVAPILEETDLNSALELVGRKLKSRFGVPTGEWAYSFVQPFVFAERLVPAPYSQFKIHCCDGVIKWVVLTTGRFEKDIRETVIHESGERLPLRFNPVHKSSEADPDLPGHWHEMLDTARVLSRGFRYVRVDFLSDQNGFYFGELTFWPLAGFPAPEYDAEFGRMLDIDLSYKREPILREFILPIGTKSLRKPQRFGFFYS